MLATKRVLAYGIGLTVLVALAYLAAYPFGEPSSALESRGTASPRPAEVGTRPRSPAPAHELSIPASPSGRVPILSAAVGDPESESAVTAPLTIQVNDEASAPSPAQVRVSISSIFDPDSPPELREGRTDEAGRAELDVPLGLVSVCAFTDDGRFGRADDYRRSSSGIHATVTLGRLANISGRVLDKSSGAPVAGARLSNHVSNTGAREGSVSGADGSFTFASWKPGSASVLTVHAEGYGTAHTTLLVDSLGRWVPIGDDAAFDMNPPPPFVEVLLEPEKWIRGRVVRTDGTGVSDAIVRAVGSVRSSFFLLVDDVAGTTSGADGSFELSGLRMDVPHLVLCETRGEGLALGWAGTDDLVVELGGMTLEPPASVSGTVRHAGGPPLAGALVRVEIEPLGVRVPEGASLPRPPPFAGCTGSDRATRDGVYTIGGLLAGRASITFEVGGDEVARQEVELVVGQQRLLDPVLIEQEVAFIEAMLVDETGNRHEGREVALVVDGSVLARAETDARGTFAMTLLEDQLDGEVALVLKNDTGGIEERWPRVSGRFPSVLRTSGRADSVPAGDRTASSH